jgi:hypothetical protein
MSGVSTFVWFLILKGTSSGPYFYFYFIESLVWFVDGFLDLQIPYASQELGT